MTPAAHALTDGLIDYAGLFPPAWGPKIQNDIDIMTTIE